MKNEAVPRLPRYPVGRAGVFYYWQVVRVGIQCRRGAMRLPGRFPSSTSRVVSAAALSRCRRASNNGLKAAHNTRRFDRVSNAVLQTVAQADRADSER